MVPSTVTVTIGTTTSSTVCTSTSVSITVTSVTSTRTSTLLITTDAPAMTKTCGLIPPICYAHTTNYIEDNATCTLH